METKNIVLLKELLPGHSDIALPTSLQDKYIELSSPIALRHYDYVIQYSADNLSLELIYMEHDEYYTEDYWGMQDIGYVIDGERCDLYEEIESLEEDNCLYFLIATYDHSQVWHYPIVSRQDITTCRWDTGIRKIFVPSTGFIQECNNDTALMIERLKPYFDEYSDWCNGYIYILCKDTYQITNPESVLFISESDSVGGFIGQQCAEENLRSYF